MNKALDALRVLLLDPKISEWLKANDPMAYRQAKAALEEQKNNLPSRPSVISQTISGEEHAKRVAARLVEKSTWFTIEPLPDDQWEFTCRTGSTEESKSDTRQRLSDVINETKEPQVVSFLLKDGNTCDLPDAPPIRVTVQPEGNDFGLMIGVEGHGLKTMQTGFEEVVVIEKYNGDVRVVIWSDINEEDPTVISLSNAKEEQRVPEDEEVLAKRGAGHE